MNTERKKPGPKPKHLAPRKEYHLKFVPEIAHYIEQRALREGYQAFFERLVSKDMEEHGSDESKDAA